MLGYFEGISPQVEHKYAMLFAGQYLFRRRVRDFYERVARDLNEPFEIVAELNMTALPSLFPYRDGRLVRAVTRGGSVRRRCRYAECTPSVPFR